jgi:hypothetical protein
MRQLFDAIEWEKFETECFWSQDRLFTHETRFSKLSSCSSLMKPSVPWDFALNREDGHGSSSGITTTMIIVTLFNLHKKHENSEWWSYI